MTELALKPPHAVRARKHAGLIGSLWLLRAATSLVIVWPLTSVIRAVYGAHPKGDAVLFEPGAEALVDFVARDLPSYAPALTAHVVVVFPLVFALHALCSGAAVVVLSREGSPAARRRAGIAQATPHAIPLLAQSFATLILEVLALVLAGIAYGVASTAFEGRGLPFAERAGVLAALPALCLIPYFEAARDASAIALLNAGATPIVGFLRAHLAVLKRPRITLAFAWRASLSLGLVFVASELATRLGGRAGGAFVVLFLAHQAVAAARTALRVSWLAAAIRLA
ncbi:MAG: hypothetical protein IPG50_06085 [Myxococcales bacterium]|nr:hypothetical protein [Myxococcales bacterium]